MPVPRHDPEVQTTAADDRAWTAADSAALYGVERWGQGYFGINHDGRLTVHPTRQPQPVIDLKQLTDELRQRGLRPPILIRFSDLLRHRLGELAKAFRSAADEFEYSGRCRCVYPIKVNQQRHIVEEMMSFGREHGFGLEAGSKPELLAIIALVDDPDTPIICNGFKDEKFIETVVLATKLGRNVIPVVEKYSELRELIRQAKERDVRLKIGIRIKLATAGAGRWESSAGPRSKFGLFVSEVLEAVEELRRADMLDSLRLLHFHMGSQISRITQIKNAIIELARLYVELRRAGAPIDHLDVGGGLGVDYEGTAVVSDSTINYTLQEYANNVVFHVRQVCRATDMPHPTIICECGRAMVAYSSVLVFSVLGWSGFDRFEVPEGLTLDQLAMLPQPLQTLYDSHHNLDDANFAEYFHDSQLNREQVVNLFNLGYCTLEHRALAERLYYGICAKVIRKVRAMESVPEEFAGLEAMLADTYFCNCSVFQSLPDHWAIGQLFPVMPIHRLDERPTCRGVLADITCDSDGQVASFPGRDGVKPVLELHPYTGAEYDLAALLVGAYQETLGDLHNLFGDTHAVHVRLDDDGRPMIDEIVEGDTVNEVLKYVQFNPDELRRRFSKAIERAVHDGRLSLDESRRLRQFYENGLSGYTYLT